jgi:hypothetical protein
MPVLNLKLGHDSQDYWVSGLSPSSGIRNTKKSTSLQKLALFLSSGEVRETL